MKIQLFLIQTAGVVHWILIAVSFLLPKKLAYEENLSKVSLIIRQIFHIQHQLIIIVLAAFGALGVFFSHELLSGNSLATFICAFIAIFWLFRLGVQLFHYDAEMRKKHPAGDLAYTCVFIFQTAIFIFAAVKGALL